MIILKGFILSNPRQRPLKVSHVCCPHLLLKMIGIAISYTDHCYRLTRRDGQRLADRNLQRNLIFQKP